MAIKRYIDGMIRWHVRKVFLDANASDLLEGLKKRLGVMENFINVKVAPFANQGTHDIKRAVRRAGQQVGEALKMAEGERVQELITTNTGPARWRGGGGFVFHEEKGNPREIAEKTKNALGTLEARGIQEEFEGRGMSRTYAFLTEGLRSIVNGVANYIIAKAQAKNASEKERANRRAMEIEATTNPSAAGVINAMSKLGIGSRGTEESILAKEARNNFKNTSESVVSGFKNGINTGSTPSSTHATVLIRKKK